MKIIDKYYKQKNTISNMNWYNIIAGHQAGFISFDEISEYTPSVGYFRKQLQKDFFTKKTLDGIWFTKRKDLLYD